MFMEKHVKIKYVHIFVLSGEAKHFQREQVTTEENHIGDNINVD